VDFEMEAKLLSELESKKKRLTQAVKDAGRAGW
jgi:hypothetical protein